MNTIELSRQSKCREHCLSIQTAISGLETSVQDGYYRLGNVFYETHISGDWLHDEIWETESECRKVGGYPLQRTWVNWLKLRNWKIKPLADKELALSARTVCFLERFPFAVDSLKKEAPELPTPTSIFQLEPYEFNSTPIEDTDVWENVEHTDKDKHERVNIYSEDQPVFVEHWRTAFEANRAKLFNAKQGTYKPPTMKQSREVMRDIGHTKQRPPAPAKERVVDVTPVQVYQAPVTVTQAPTATPQTPTTPPPKPHVPQSVYTPPPQKSLKEIQLENVRLAQQQKEMERVKEQQRLTQEVKDYFLAMRDVAESVRKLKSFLGDRVPVYGSDWLEDLRNRDAAAYSMGEDKTMFMVIMSDLQEVHGYMSNFYEAPEDKTVDID